MSKQYQRLPVPQRAHIESRFEKAGLERDSAPVFAPLVFDSIVLSTAGILLGTLVWLPLLLIVLIPILHAVNFTWNMSRLQSFLYRDDNADESSLYAKAVRAYRNLYDPEHRAEALPMLEKVYDHEMALRAIGKTHYEGRYDSADCAPCLKRIKLMREMDKYQPVPETTTYDIDHVAASLEVKKEMLALTAGSK